MHVKRIHKTVIKIDICNRDKTHRLQNDASQNTDTDKQIKLQKNKSSFRIRRQRLEIKYKNSFP